MLQIINKLTLTLNNSSSILKTIASIAIAKAIIQSIDTKESLN